MKYLIIIVAGLLFVGCGNPNFYRSGKLRKFKVHKSKPKKEEIVADQSFSGAFEKEEKIEAMQEQETIVVHDDLVEEVHTLEEDDSQAVDEVTTDFQEDIVCLESESEQRADEAHDISQKSSGVRAESKAKSTKKKRREIDWYSVGYYSLIAVILAGIVVGLIYAPVITLSLISIFLAVVIIIICGAIVWFFIDLFDMMFA